MYRLPYLTSADAEITIEKLDKVAKSLSEKIKSFAKFFGIIFGWCIFNLIVSLFVSRTRSLSLETYRMISEGLRTVASQDVLFILTIMFDDKINCVISIAMIIVFGMVCCTYFINLGNKGVANTSSAKHTKSVKSSFQCENYVVSYKQQVAFLA